MTYSKMNIGNLIDPFIKESQIQLILFHSIR